MEPLIWLAVHFLSKCLMWNYFLFKFFGSQIFMTQFQLRVKGYMTRIEKTYAISVLFAKGFNGS